MQKTKYKKIGITRRDYFQNYCLRKVFQRKKSGKYFQTLTSSKFKILILLGVKVLKIKSLKENINISGL